MNGHFISRQTCPGCGGAQAQTLFARAYADSSLRSALEKFYSEVGALDYSWLLGAEYVVQECGACGLVFQRDVPDDFLLQKLYEEWISPARAFDRFHAHVSRDRVLEISREIRLSLSLAREGTRPVRALDYGCGWGEWGRTIKAFGAETWGTELSAARREACQRDGIRVVDEAELPTNYFDVVSADQVFEHLPSPARTLTLLVSKLRPGGIIRIAVPNGWRIASKLKRFEHELKKPRLGGLNPIAPLEHLNCFTNPSLLRLAAGCGLVRQIPPWSGLLRAAHFPRSPRRMLKEALRPAYLRSRWSTQLWFRSATAANA